MRSIKIMAVAMAAVLIGLSACKMDMGSGDDDSSSSLVGLLADMEGYQYYEHENTCNEFPTLCDDGDSNSDILDRFNDDDAPVDEFGSEDGIDADGDNMLDAIGVDVDGDGVFDFVVADMDADGVFDTILVKDGMSVADNSGSGAVSIADETEIIEDFGNGFPNDRSYESTENQNGISYGELTWCGVNTITDSTGDGIVSWEDIKNKKDGIKAKGNECNDPDWFCNASVTDRRCLDADVKACAIDPNGSCK